MVKNALVATFAICSTFGGNAKGDEKSKSYNTLLSQGFEVCVMDVRATTYHKTESSSDKETRRGNSSLGLPLREVGPKTVGSIAIDPKVIPYGSLVIVTTKSGATQRFLCVDTGAWVKSRKASKLLAKREKLGREFAERPVIDIYSAKTYNNWMTVVVVKDNSLKGLSTLALRNRLKGRMSADFWPDGQEIVSRALQQRESNLLSQK